MDGARLWECQAYYGKSYAEIAQGFASVYVSTYKALGGIAGAVLAGDEDFIAEARLWQRRMGGILVRQSPMIASAAMRLDHRLGVLGACYERALSLAKGLARLQRIRINPATPRTNMMHIHFDASAETILWRRDEIAEREGAWVINGARATDVPGWCLTELSVGDTLVERDNADVLPLFEALLHAGG
jgi:threonine aldolase